MDINNARLTNDERANIVLKVWGEPFNAIPTKDEFVHAMTAISEAQLRKALWFAVMYLKERYTIYPMESTPPIALGSALLNAGIDVWSQESTTQE